jgi:hypothetical protein
MAEGRMDIGFQAFRRGREIGIILGWPIQRSDGGDCGTRTRFLAFGRNPRCAASSVIRRLGSSSLCGAQKNDLRLLRRCAVGLVRAQDAAGARSVVRRCAGVSRARDSASRVPGLRQGEAGATGVPGRQPVLYQALCSLRGPALSHGDDQGPGRGAQPRLGYGRSRPRAQGMSEAQALSPFPILLSRKRMF